MALPQYDMEVMIANIKRRCAVPTSQLTYRDSDFTDLCNDELQGEVVPLLMSTREEYFVEPLADIPAPTDGIIKFPEETVASKVRSVCYVQSTNPLVLSNLPRIDLDVVAGVGYANYDSVTGFYIQGDSLILYPNSTLPAGTNIRIYIYKRTLTLAQPTAYGKVLSINSMANTLVLDYVPTNWVVGDSLNSVSSTQQFGVTNKSMEILTLSSPTVGVDDVTDVEVGDFVSFEGYSAVPQVPIEAHAYLAQLTAAKCLEGLGDRQGMESALGKAMQLKESLLVMLSQRVDGSVKKVMNPSGGLRLGAGIGRWGGGWSGGGYW